MDETQTYANHRRFYPLYHFVVVPLLSLNVVMQLWIAIRQPSIWSFWSFIVALALLGLSWVARIMVLRVQDRVIRLEERLRLQQILPADLRGRIGELRPRHLIAMRFADDAEVPDLCRRVLAGELQTGDDIKRRVKTWRPDTLRA